MLFQRFEEVIRLGAVQICHKKAPKRVCARLGFRRSALAEVHHDDGALGNVIQAGDIDPGMAQRGFGPISLQPACKLVVSKFPGFIRQTANASASHRIPIMLAFIRQTPRIPIMLQLLIAWNGQQNEELATEVCIVSDLRKVKGGARKWPDSCLAGGKAEGA